MEQELRSNLQSCAEAFASARGFEISTVGRLAANDGSFFSRISAGRSFTARKYDEIIRFFSDNWPPTVPWPRGVQRPVAETVRAAQEREAIELSQQCHARSSDVAANSPDDLAGEGASHG